MTMHSKSISRSIRRALLCAGLVGLASVGVADELPAESTWTYGGAFAAWAYGRGPNYMDSIRAEYAHALTQPENRVGGHGGAADAVTGFAPWAGARGTDVGRSDARSRATPWTYTGVFSPWSAQAGAL
jgi:hypothetical protein